MRTLHATGIGLLLATLASCSSLGLGNTSAASHTTTDRLFDLVETGELTAAEAKLAARDEPAGPIIDWVELIGTVLAFTTGGGGIGYVALRQMEKRIHSKRDDRRRDQGENVAHPII